MRDDIALQPVLCAGQMQQRWVPPLLQNFRREVWTWARCRATLDRA